MKHRKRIEKWMVLWSSYNNLDGRREHFILYDWQDWSRGLLVFTTKKACQSWIKERYGYIARRDDLRNEPHCWRMPQAVRVQINIGEIIDRKFAPTIWSPRGLPKDTTERRRASWAVRRRSRQDQPHQGTARKRASKVG